MRLASIVVVAMSLALGTGIIAAAPLLGQIPIAALVGIMLLVCQQTFNWSSLRLVGKVPRLDIAVILLVSYITVVEDLAKAVVAGTIVSALSFAWKQSTQIFCDKSVNEKGWRVFKLNGPIFFGSTQKVRGAKDEGSRIPRAEKRSDVQRRHEHLPLPGSLRSSLTPFYRRSNAILTPL